MKKTLKPILSILLAFAMILPMCGIARADGETVTLGSSTVAMDFLPYTEAASQPTQTITATPTGFADGTTYEYNWTSSNSNVVAIVSGGNAATVTVRSVAAGTSDLTCVVTPTNNGTVGSAVTSSACTVTVTTVSASTLSTKATNTNIALGGGTLQASVELTYANSSSSKETSPANGVVTYESSDNTVASVSSNGLITPLKVGTAIIKATFTPTSGTAISDSTGVSINVTPATGGDNSVSATAYTDSGAYLANLTNGVSNIYSQILAKYQATYGATATPGANATIAISQTSAASYGTVTANSITVTNSLFSDLNTSNTTNSVYFTPAYAGTYTASYTLTDSANRTLTGTLTINVTTRTQNVNITLPNSGAAYYFSGYDAGGVNTGYGLLTDAAGTNAAKIRFAANATNSASTSGQIVGTLYTDATSSIVLGNGVQQASIPVASLSSLTFVPTGYTGTYSIGYEALNSSDYVVKSGTLTIRVTTGSLNVSFNLNTGASYTFSSKTDTSSGIGTGDSAYNLITSAILNYGLTGSNYYIYFDTPSSASAAVGTLYYSATARAVSSTDPISYTQLSSLYFTPSQAGAYQTTYRVYSTSDTTSYLASGTLTINVASIFGDADFTYTTTYGQTVTLKESDFASFLTGKSSSYTLSSVVFTDYRGSGTFYYGSSSFVPRSATFYARTYNGTLPANARYLDGVTFTAPTSGAGYTAVSFTAYATNGSSYSGVFHISYTAAAVPAVEYSAYSTYGTYAVTLREADFVPVYRTAMGVTTTSPQFYIRFKSVPGFGLLYQNYASSINTGSQLTSSTIATGAYYVGGSANRSVSTLTYVPLNGNFSVLSATYGTVDTVEYTAYSTSGTELFAGKIRFKLAPDKTASVTSDGLDFSVTDFYSVTDADPVLYVTFSKPLAGKMYVTSGSQMTAITDTDRLYITSPTDGKYPISAAHYVPQAGQTASVTLSYTAHTKSGASYTGSIMVNPTSKTSSTTFSDVTGITGSWAANSVDFASKYNLVKGSGGGKFSPDAAMHRCDLILIFYRLAGSPSVSGTVPYTDVAAATDSYSTEIYNSALWASRNGIVDGIVSGTTYAPSTDVTRQEYIRILYNYAKYAGANLTNSGSLSRFADASNVASYATEAMRWAVANNYTTGTDATHLSPTLVANRAQIVTFLHRYLTY